MALDEFFLIVGSVLLIGFSGNLIRQRTHIPESLFLISFGLLIGPLTGIVPGSALLDFVPIVSVAAMIAILLEAGIGFDVFRIRESFGKAALFTLLVALFTTALITALLVLFFGWEPAPAALLGLISSGTTTITAMSLIQHLDISGKVKRLILLETIINDFTLILGTFLIVEYIKYSTLSFERAGNLIVSELSIGIVLGMALGMLWRYVLEDLNLRRELNYASTLGFCFVLYYIASYLGGNPIISVFAFSIFLGNYYRIYELIKPQLPAPAESAFGEVLRSIRFVQTDFTFFVKSFFFVLLGITFSTALLDRISPLLIVAMVILILVARFIASAILSRLDKEISRYRTLISIMIPRGYVAAVLAFVPAQEGIQIPLLTDIIVLLIIITTIIAIAGTMAYGKSHPAQNDKKKGK